MTGAYGPGRPDPRVLTPEQASDEAMRLMVPMLRAVRETMYLGDGAPARVEAQAEKRYVLALIERAEVRADPAELLREHTQRAADRILANARQAQR